MAFARMLCWQDTVERAARIDPPPLAEKRKYDPMFNVGGCSSPPVITVEQVDCIDCALQLRAAGMDPVLLSLADPHLPGGSVPLGTVAHEESIFRRTNMHLSLVQELYPLEMDEVIYSPGITVLKDSTGAPLEAPLERSIAVITCAGLREPDCRIDHRTRERRLRPPDVTRMRTKVRAVLQAAHTHGHDAVVLGALGCGRGQCPSWHVAQVFREVLEEMGGAFRHVAFAILSADVLDEFRKQLITRPKQV